MPRIARIVGVGLPHHVTQRGNYQQQVFGDDKDREKYLLWIKEYSLKYGLSILAYCLMNNHVHFIAVPLAIDSLAKTFNTAHMRYSQYFNRKRNTKGHLWQGRFYSCIMDESHCMAAARYIERNPVRAKLVRHPSEWKWSSALAHISGNLAHDFKLGDLFQLIGIPSETWGGYIDSKEDSEMIRQIRKHTLTGRPLGATEFLEQLGKTFDRKLNALPRGRPKKMVAVPIKNLAEFVTVE